MARICISLSGEGRGHATRVRALIEALQGRHSITVFAPGDAHAFLAPIYQNSEIHLRRIAGLRFHYTRKGRLDSARTLFEALGYLRRIPVLFSVLEQALRHAEPDLVITDFEPALPRVARRLGIPFVSVDHQHFLTACDLSSLPIRLRCHAHAMGAVVRAWNPGEAGSVVSSFYFPPLRSSAVGTTQVGVMLRPILRDLPTSPGDHLVVYLRRFAGKATLEALGTCGRKVRIYGLGARPSLGNLTFLNIHEAGFLEDLAGSAALVCTAGNQLVGEALFLGKPVLALPEPNNHEQAINAHYLREGGGGDWTPFELLTASRLQHFLGRAEGGSFKLNHPRSRLDGLPPTLAFIERHLPDSRDPAWLPTHPKSQPDREPPQPR